MPARRFFAMREAATELDARDKIDAADIAAIPLYSGKYHQSLVKQFELEIPEIQKARERARIEKEQAPKLKGTEAKNAMQMIFAGKAK